MQPTLDGVGGGQLWTVQLNKRNAPRCVFRKKKKTAHPVSCGLHPVHSRDDGGSIVSENVTNTYAFWQSFAAERFVSRSSYSQCGLTYVKCSDKGAEKNEFFCFGFWFWKEPSGWWASVNTLIYSHISLRAQRIQVPLTPAFISMRLILYLFPYCNWRRLMNNLVGPSRLTSGVTLKVNHPKNFTLSLADSSEAATEEPHTERLPEVLMKEFWKGRETHKLTSWNQDCCFLQASFSFFFFSSHR